MLGNLFQLIPLVSSILASLESLIPLATTVLIVLAVYYVAKLLLDRQRRGHSDSSLIRSLTLFVIVSIGAIAILLAIPFDPEFRGQLTGLIGIVLSAVFALSSATFIGNGLAGIMMRAINNYRLGDFIHVGDHFGRITERGLFHTEIQMENRDLTTLPNMHLATNPVRVTRSSGTFITAEVSLGYDVNRKLIKKTLLEAASEAGLEDAFIQVTSLGDFSVVYKVNGLLKEIKTVISARSRLYEAMLDKLHDAHIEIVSPSFMNQKQVGDTVFIPKKSRAKEAEETENPEALIFDKADKAETIEKRQQLLAETQEKIRELLEAKKADTTEEGKLKFQNKIERYESITEKLQKRIEEDIKNNA